MIVWINGAFGSGKTTLVEEVRRHWPAALVYDPENVGYLLGEIVPAPTGDFQDQRLWRRQVVSFALGLLEEYGRPLLVPMTLVDPRYVSEIFDSLDAAGATVRHFFLRVTPEVLVRRLDARSVVPDDPARDEVVRQWCKERIARCVAAVDALPAGTAVLDGERPVGELAAEVLGALGVLGAPGAEVSTSQGRDAAGPGTETALPVSDAAG